jgi:hypothetical protein
LRDADSACNFGLGESKVLAPCCHGGDATLKREVHDLVGHGPMREAALHAAELLVGNNYEGGLPVLAYDDLKLSTCVHRAS